MALDGVVASPNSDGAVIAARQQKSHVMRVQEVHRSYSAEIRTMALETNFKLVIFCQDKLSSY